MKITKGKARIAEKKRQDELKKQSYKLAEINKQEELKKAAERELREAEEKKKRDFLAGIEKENPDMAKVKKSGPKAAGLKSTFIISEDKLLMTSFGKGNKALLDKYVEGEVIRDASETSVLAVKKKDKKFTVSGRISKDAVVDNPLFSTKLVGMDQIRCKDKFEQMYFGKTFVDNIHIQLVYKILDIEKILTIHLNNIVFELDNLLREENEEHDDLIGYLSDWYSFKKFKTYKEGVLYQKFKSLIGQKQLGYFGSTFVPKKRMTEVEQEEFEKKCYHLLLAVATVRHATAHGKENIRSKLYDLDALFKGDVSAELDSLYMAQIEKLKKSFVNTSKRDISIIFAIFNAKTDEEKKKYIVDYYNFVMKKSFKNLGFSIKRVRENVTLLYPELKDDKYSSVRRKLYKLLDFVISEYYEDNDQKIVELIEKLRSCARDSEKELVYHVEAEELWGTIGGTIKNVLLPRMNTETIGSINGIDIDSKIVDEIAITADASTFSKMIYLLTVFLDGKEINDLLTQLISNLENIAGFIETMREENIECSFLSPYTFFESSQKVADELRLINSFSRMTDSEQSAKKVMYMEAVQLLGYGDAEEKDLETYIDDFTNKEKLKIVNGKKDTNFRNFIANNVIESNRFKYLVRYGNPAKLRKLAENEKVVDFVLKDIPDNQIRAYYNSCNNTKLEYNDTMRADLSNKIVHLSFHDFEDVKQKVRVGSQEAIEKERKKNIVRLYLTVLYLLVKNLVYVNSRYYLAFHCVERDRIVYLGDACGEISKTYENDDISWLSFAKQFVEENSNNKRAKQYLATNFHNADAWCCAVFRNCTAHLSAIRNADKYINDIGAFDSYFELYHYLVQRTIMDQYAYDCQMDSRLNSGKKIMDQERLNPKVLEYFDKVKKYHSYCKDFVKALNTPFAYNLARYKNLSINELFDRNNYLPEKAKEAENE